MDSVSHSLDVGRYRIDSIVEWVGGIYSPADLFPQFDADTWARHRHRLTPTHYLPGSGFVNSAVRTWVVRSQDVTILVDTGIGNGRTLAGLEMWNDLDTAWLAHLEAQGVAPEGVDFVVCTHLHCDHIGWNTTGSSSGGWEPTFPNATYLFHEADVAYWGRAAASNPGPGSGNRAVRNARAYNDSVRPVIEAGLSQVWRDRFDIAPGAWLEPAPGHTPGTCVLKLSSAGAHAIFVGDIIDSPIQVLEPSWNSGSCVDAGNSRRARLEVLDWAADNAALLVPAHFAGAGHTGISKTPHGYDLQPWRAR